MADLGRSLASPFRDPAWPTRAIVGAALELVPFLVTLPLALRFLHRSHAVRGRDVAAIGLASLLALVCRWIEMGYLRRVATVTLTGSGEGLPPWDRFGEDLVEGFKLFLAALGVFLPAIAVAAALAFTTATLSTPHLAWIPVALILPPLALLTVFYLPAALMTAIAANDIGRAFDVGGVLAVIGRSPSSYLLAFVISLIALLLAQLGFLLLCIGVFATRFLAGCVAVHAFASAYAESLALPSSQA